MVSTVVPLTVSVIVNVSFAASMRATCVITPSLNVAFTEFVAPLAVVIMLRPSPEPLIVAPLAEVTMPAVSFDVALSVTAISKSEVTTTYVLLLTMYVPFAPVAVTCVAKFKPLTVTPVEGITTDLIAFAAFSSSVVVMLNV